ncbi:hypothetical protein ATE84_4537 [Aquimarina sp. MAR_2010_214]|uniref:RHS repeat protein n=1 Tax=Aquimarina sp. MAR_2010_214 TaxID=1250026 RepID=UPI000C712FA4|nr:RHS repeat protein [Aquimarina sp. MAR_2010_214]PKV52422.1 hypothetical protein ATE84_4537 [Aquimarina sp. MAR_2010_214]
MKKTLFIGIILCHVCIGLFGQTSSPVKSGNKSSIFDPFIPKVVPPSVGTFQTVNLTDINSYQGVANINIPIYTIQIGKISVPISINYNTSGVKPNQISSNVGQNWSLQAGGQVVKITKGQEDFSASFSFPYNTNDPSYTLVKYQDLCHPEANNNKLKNIGWLLQGEDFSTQTYLDFSSSCSNTIYAVADIAENPKIERDTYPDLFAASAPGLNSKFTHRLDRSIQEIEKQGYRIETTIGKSEVINLFPKFHNANFPLSYQTFDGGTPRRLVCVNKIDITNTSGTQYVFKDLDIAQYVQRDALNSIPTQDVGSVLLTNQEVSAYNLSTIQDTEGNKVDFIYEKYQIATSEYSKSSEYSLTKNETYLVNNLFSTEKKYPQLNRLKRIVYRTGSVEFVYGKSRLDLTGDNALTQIVIKDMHQKIIKKVNLKQGYFVSNNGCSEPTCKRLKLEQVIIEGRDGLKMPPYRFFYNSTKLPERGSTYIDFLGYANAQVPSEFNGVSVIKNKETTLVPPPIIYFYPYKKRFSFSPFKIYTNSYTPSGGVSLSSNLGMSQAAILTRMEKPTGASEEFVYELNSFITNDGKEITGGGLRIKENKIVSESGDVYQKNYKYVSETGLSSGYINNLPLYGIAQAYDNGYNIRLGSEVKANIISGNIALKYFLTSRTNLELTNGAFVGYSRIEIEKNQNKYKELTYTSPKDYPLEEPDFYPLIGGLNEVEIQYAYDNGGFFPHFNTRDILLGKMTKSKTYNDKNEVLIEESMDYQYKVFETSIQTIKVPKSQIVVQVSSAADYNFEFKPKIFTHRNLKSLDEKTSILDTKRIIERTKYWYSNEYPFIEKTEQIGGRFDQKVTTQYFYPFSIAPNTFNAEQNTLHQELIQIHNINTPILQESWFNKPGFTSPKLVSRQKTMFTKFSGNILTSEIKTSKDGSSFDSRIRIKSYDNFGNLTSYRKSEGTDISYIWGYKNSLLLAKLENVKYSSIPNTLITQIQNLSDVDTDNCRLASCKEEALRIELQKLRDYFPNGQITTYTYDPNIGITSTIDSRGYATYYTYDHLNRLESVKDADNHLISKNKYHYKNQQ